MKLKTKSYKIAGRKKITIHIKKNTTDFTDQWRNVNYALITKYIKYELTHSSDISNFLRQTTCSCYSRRHVFVRALILPDEH